MRVLHILDHSVPLQSGYTFRTLAILKQQRALGWETFQLTGLKHAAVVGDETVNGLRFFRTPSDGPAVKTPVLREIDQMRRLAGRIEQIAMEVRPDVLHAHSPVLNALPALRVGKKLGIPVVYEVRAFWEDAAVDHGTSTENGLRYRATRALETWALKRADAVTTICQGLRNEILSRGIPSGRVTVIPNAVDIEQFTESEAASPELKASLGLEGALVFGFVGSFYAYEGLELLLQAMPAIVARFPEAKVLLVGGGPEEGRLRQLCGDPVVDRMVRFAGRVPHDDVQRYYNLIDVLVYPRQRMRLTELVTPLKPLEAMAQQKLLIASNVGGHRELIRHGETGMLFEAGDAAALARCAIELVEARASWPALRAAGRQFVETERNWRRSVSYYGDVYAEARRNLVAGGVLPATLDPSESR